jgi:type I restriction enzyme S subunit
VRKGETSTEILSVTNDRGFVRSLEVFDKQVFSQDVSNYKLVRFNDIAYNPSRINVGSAARCEFLDGGAVSPMYVVVRCKKTLLPQYLLYFIKSDVGLQHIAHRCIGAVRFMLRFKDLEHIELPIPPIHEQERIIRILDEADALRRLRANACARASQIQPALFNAMFGEPRKNPHEWPRGLLSDVIHSAKDGPHVSPKYVEMGVPFLSTRNVRAGQIVWEDLKYISPEEAKIHWRKSKPERGDVLYTKGGTTGLAKAIDFDTEVAVWVHIAVLKTNQDIADPVWLESMLNTRYCYAQSQELTHGIGNRDLGLTRMVNIQIYIPPLNLQQDFSKRVLELSKFEAAQTVSRYRLDNLFQSLIQSAFQGGL